MIDRNDRIEDQEELQRTIFETLQTGLWTTLPGIIDSVNLEAQTCSVVPAIRAKVKDSAGNITDVELPLLVDVPIIFSRAGGFALTFPVAIGDECLVIFASRCIDAWWQSGGVQNQAELRMHDLSDGFCMLAPTSQPKKLSNVSAVNVQLRNEAGDTYIEITPDGKVKVMATNDIDIISAERIKMLSSPFGNYMEVKPDGECRISNGPENAYMTIKENGKLHFQGEEISFGGTAGGTIFWGNIYNYFGKMYLTTGVNITDHVHEQPNDAGGDAEVDTNAPKNP